MKALALFLLQRAASMLLGELWLFLQSAVAVYAQDGSTLSSDEKRTAVQELAITQAKKLGLSWSASLINLGIEAAVVALKGKQA